MHNKPSPITQMLIREIAEVKVLLAEVKQKIASINEEEVKQEILDPD